MRRSDLIREIWEILETDTSDSIDKAEKILAHLEEAGISPPEVSRNIKAEEVAEFSLQGYDVSEDDLIMVAEWEDECNPDKSKLN